MSAVYSAILPPSLMVFFCKPSQGSVHYVLPCARLQSYMGPGHSQVGAHAINHVNKSQPRTGLNKLSANKHINSWPRQTCNNISWILLGPSKERLRNPQSSVLSRQQCGILVITTKPKSRIIRFESTLARGTDIPDGGIYWYWDIGFTLFLQPLVLQTLQI